MRNSLIIASFLFLTCISCNSIKYHDPIKVAKQVDPFANIKFDKAIAYDFAGDTDIPLLDSNNKITNTVTKQLELDSFQLEKIKIILMDSSSFGGQIAKDFYPNFGIIFYLQNKIVQRLEISFPCNGIFATFNIPELNKREYPYDGFTKKGREALVAFCKEIGFKQYMDRTRWFQN